MSGITRTVDTSFSWMSHNKPSPCRFLPLEHWPALSPGSEEALCCRERVREAFLPKASYETIHQVWQLVAPSVLQRRGSGKEGDGIDYDIVLQDNTHIPLESLLADLENLAQVLTAHRLEWQSDRVIECIHLQNEMIARVHSLSQQSGQWAKIKGKFEFFFQQTRLPNFLPADFVTQEIEELNQSSGGSPLPEPSVFTETHRTEIVRLIRIDGGFPSTSKSTSITYLKRAFSIVPSTLVINIVQKIAKSRVAVAATLRAIPQWGSAPPGLVPLVVSYVQ